MSSGARIRPVVASDLEALVTLEHACFGAAAWSRAGISGALGADGALALVALDEATTVVGAAVWHLVLDEAELLRIAVDPTLRRRGLAARLLCASELELEKRGVTQLHLEVRADNHAAIELYQTRGWAHLGRREGYYGDGVDALLLARRLG